MKTKMTHAMRMEFADAIRGRYAAAANKGLSLGNCITRLGAAERKCSSSRRGS